MAVSLLFSRRRATLSKPASKDFFGHFRKIKRIIRKSQEVSKDFLEIYCAANLEICEKRDTKGLYAKARAGQIKEFTGISSPYEEPNEPDLRLDTGIKNLNECVEEIIIKLSELEIIK